MGIGAGVGLLLGGLAAGGGAVVSSVIGSNAAGDATKAQTEAADKSTEAQERMSKEAIAAYKEAQDKAIATQLEMFYKSREDLAPWREMGGDALAQLKSIFMEGGGIPGISNEPFTPTTIPEFNIAPVPEAFRTPEYQKSPYYNFLLDEGMQAQARAASAAGRLDSGAALKDATRFGQGLASTDYQNWLNNYINAQTFQQSQKSNALTDWLRKKQFSQGERSNYINEWLTTKANPLLSLAGAGQVSAGQGANLATQTGQGIAQNYLNTGQNIGRNLQATGANIGQNYLAAGQARAGGAINRANAITGGIGSLSNIVNQGINNYLFYDYLKNRGSVIPMSTVSRLTPNPYSY